MGFPTDGRLGRRGKSSRICHYESILTLSSCFQVCCDVEVNALAQRKHLDARRKFLRSLLTPHPPRPLKDPALDREPCLRCPVYCFPNTVGNGGNLCPCWSDRRGAEHEDTHLWRRSLSVASMEIFQRSRVANPIRFQRERKHDLPDRVQQLQHAPGSALERDCAVSRERLRHAVQRAPAIRDGIVLRVLEHDRRVHGSTGLAVGIHTLVGLSPCKILFFVRKPGCWTPRNSIAHNACQSQSWHYLFVLTVCGSVHSAPRRKNQHSLRVSAGFLTLSLPVLRCSLPWEYANLVSQLRMRLVCFIVRSLTAMSKLWHSAQLFTWQTSNSRMHQPARNSNIARGIQTHVSQQTSATCVS